MKLWTAVPLQDLPDIFQNGLIDHSHQGIEFSPEAEMVAEYAMELKDELAFLEGEFPDDELDDWFTICMEAASAEHTDVSTDIGYKRANLEALIEANPEDPAIPGLQEEIEAQQQHADQIWNMQTGAESLALTGRACIWRTVPITMLKLLNPETMMEAVWTQDTGAIAEAIETTEAYGLETLGASFWVWLMFLFQNIFAAGRGELDVRPAWQREAEEKAAARRARKRKRKGRPKKKPRRRKKEPVS